MRNRTRFFVVSALALSSKIRKETAKIATYYWNYCIKKEYHRYNGKRLKYNNRVWRQRVMMTPIFNLSLLEILL
jgi:hypothetical protein